MTPSKPSSEELEDILLKFDLALPNSKGGITLNQATTALRQYIDKEVLRGRPAASMGDQIYKAGRNSLRASQRKAWAKACGVAE